MLTERERMIHPDERLQWRHWGPYLSERQWGTVREDYSADGNAWSFFPHDHARSRAYRWGEDGIGGWSDKECTLCFSVAMWNGKDPILKERLFGLVNEEGNHGEDVKEYWFHEDALPSHAWNRMMYVYPQTAFPYDALVAENHRRTKADDEYELADTGILDEKRFFEVWISYAKRGAEETVLHIEVVNRGPETAELHLLPQAFFRNTWSWNDGARPSLERGADGASIVAKHPVLGNYVIRHDPRAEQLFCDNDTNVQRHGNEPRNGRFFKDGIHARVVESKTDAVNPAMRGTKVALWHRLTIPAGGRESIDITIAPEHTNFPMKDAPVVLEDRKSEADEYYEILQALDPNPEVARMQRQAWAGILWSKQYYEYDVRRWLEGDPTQPPPPAARKSGRNHDWAHLSASSVLSMPDTWEYPWFAAWDLCFHCVAIAPIDAEFAKDQLKKIVTDHYMHPNGAMPAYEWAFGDVNPPIHAWAAMRVFQIDRRANGVEDLDFLASIFNRLLMNFTWWVNRKDADGRNIFEGGFLGLDNVGVFDRSQPLPTGGRLRQADGTSWMAMFALTMMKMALELAHDRPFYQDLAAKFFEHFLQIAQAMSAVGDGQGLWDEAEGFYFDVIELPEGKLVPLKLFSIVGLMPLFCVETIEPELLEKLPVFRARLEWYLKERPELAGLVSRWTEPGRGDRRLLSLLRGHRMKALLRKALDETHFLSPHGVRSMSAALRDRPFVFFADNAAHTVQYEPAESRSGLFGGNSNWRGPVWLPINFLLVESLQKFHHYYGDEFKLEYPVGSGKTITILDAADEIVKRLSSLFLPGADGVRPCMNVHPAIANDPTFKTLINFYEYFDGDTGRGCGASHQTGWSAVIAKLTLPRRLGDPSAPHQEPSVGQGHVPYA